MNKKLPEIGIGLRHVHFNYLENELPTNINFFEIISENYMNTKGRPFNVLTKLLEKFSVYMHGVSLSIASAEKLDQIYLAKLKTLIEIVNPPVISDHLCFTGMLHSNVHNLLPFPYNEENLKNISKKVEQVQNFLKREIALENLSAYFSLKNSEMTEGEFLNELANRSGCKILLDLNNVYVNSINQNFNADRFLNAIDLKNVVQIHLAGFTDFGDYLFDTHSDFVHPDVWQLYQKIIAQKNIPTLIEWDENIPEFDILVEEANKAKFMASEVINENG